MGEMKELFTCMNCTNLLETSEEWNCGFCEECFQRSLKSFEKFSSDFDENPLDNMFLSCYTINVGERKGE